MIFRTNELSSKQIKLTAQSGIALAFNTQFKAKLAYQYRY